MTCLFLFVFSLLSVQAFAKTADDFVREAEEIEFQANTQVKSVVAGSDQVATRPVTQQKPQNEVAPTDEARTEILAQQLSATIQHLTGKIEQLEYRLGQLEQKTGTAPIAAMAVTEPLKKEFTQVAEAPVDDKTPSPDPIENGPESTVKTLGSVPKQALDDMASHRPQPVKEVTKKEIAANKTAYPEGAKAHYDYAYKMLGNKEMPEARAAFEAFIQKYPKHELVSTANFWVGDTYYSEKQYDVAAKKFLVGYQQYKATPKAPDMLLKLAMSLDQMGEKSKACTSLKKLRSEFPKAKQAVLDHAQNLQKKLKCPG